MASAWGKSWGLSWLNSWGTAVTPPQPDQHDGGYIPEHLLRWWKKQHEKKKPTLAEVIEAVQENPVEALKAVPEARKQFQGIDYSKVSNNAEMALFIAKQLIITLELRRIRDEEDETEAVMLLLM